jgi:predicted RND superfamily exporter protein
MMEKLVALFVSTMIRFRIAVVIIVGVLTVVFMGLAAQLPLKTIFDDLLPSNHPYIQVHQKYKQTFGSSNLVSLMLRVEQGDIFRTEVLQEIQTATTALQQVKGIDQFQIISLASKKLKEVIASTTEIKLRPLMWPEVPKTPEEIAQLKQAVLQNPLVYGIYVSPDLKSALITADFIDRDLDYTEIFTSIRAIADRAEASGVVKTHLVGEPILYGWVAYYLPETMLVLGACIAVLALLLFLITRTFRGTVLPMISGVVSASWSLGVARLMGFNLDPLVIVVAFLITARAISHAVQLVIHFDDEIRDGAPDPKTAARQAMQALFKPGMLGVLADAGCIMVVLLIPIPLMQKVALIGTVWVLTIAISAVVLTPVLLSWTGATRERLRTTAPDRWMAALLARFADLATQRRSAIAIVAGTTVLFVVSGLYSLKLTIGDANPGSPILWGKSEYNRDAALINSNFPGSDRMFVVISDDQTDGLKETAAVETMARLQRHMEDQPEVGGSVSLADIIPAMKRTLREGNPRYEEFGMNASENGEIMYLYTSGTDPGDIDRFVDAQYRNASVTFFFRDHQGETIRTAVARLQEFIAKNADSPVQIQLAGGLVGVLAAANEVILEAKIGSIALALVVLILTCAIVYRTLHSGTLFMVPVLLSNTVTFSFMVLMGIGMNVNTLPIAALGIGLGVDYAFYVVDEIKEEMARGQTLEQAIRNSLMSAGRGVFITAATLILSVVIWYLSSVRFQAEMGLLMALWLTVSAASALILMPALVYLVRPRFVVGNRQAAPAPGSLQPA